MHLTLANRASHRAVRPEAAKSGSLSMVMMMLTPSFLLEWRRRQEREFLKRKYLAGVTVERLDQLWRVLHQEMVAKQLRRLLHLKASCWALPTLEGMMRHAKQKMRIKRRKAEVTEE